MKVCNKCKEEKSESYFYKKGQGLTSNCKPCQKVLNRKYQERNKVSLFFSYAASDIRRRTDPDRSPEKSYIYIKRGIKCLLGNTTKEVSTALRNNFEDEVVAIFERGGRPSVDRIDPFGHYELGNIQILTVEENISRRIPSNNKIKVTNLKGEVKYFDSILGASEGTGSNRTTIRNQIDGIPKFNKRGLKFERVV